MRIIDCFPYFNEEELLELRIRLLYDYVDKFIIADADKTHRGDSKPFTCLDTLKRLNLPLDKIQVIESNLPSFEEEPNAWVRETMQRNIIAEYVEDGDICIVGDCDEIINPDFINYYINTAKSYPNNILKIPMVYLTGRADLMACYEDGTPRIWTGAFICLKHHLDKYTLSDIRGSFVSNPHLIEYSNIFITDDGVVKNAGWHFTWMGDIDRVKLKYNTFLHYDEFQLSENYFPKENSPDCLGRTDHILKKYPLENLPNKIFEIEKIKNFLLPKINNSLKIAFHSNQLGLRGTEVALYDYALGNEEILNNQSIIISDLNSDLSSLNKFENRFKVILYNNFSEVEKIVEEENIDAIYYIKAGYNDGRLINNTKNLIHSVFQYYDPHGDKYSYVSQWLSKKMTNNEDNFVPHIINLPDIKDNYRELLNIPLTSLVFGRYGGYEEFNYEWVHSTVEKIAKENPDIFFLFMNTRQFCKSLPNIIHMKSTYDLKEKTIFINTCDALLHGRNNGETFGLTIGEFLHQDKPVISCPQGEDKGHVIMLQDKGIWYDNSEELYNILISFKRTTPIGYYKELVKDYTPKKVMDKFKKIFLSQIKTKMNSKLLLNRCREYGFEFDQLEQLILYNAAKSIKGIEGIVCEIGLRAAGGMSVIMVGCLDNDDPNHPFLAIDPYGNIAYNWQENMTVFTDYTNQMKNKTLSNLYNFCFEKNLNFNLFCLEDIEFFDKFENGVPIYANGEKIIFNKYALVHFDGPHSVKDIINEVKFFKHKMSIGGMLVFDDVGVGYYDHNQVESYIMEGGYYELIEKCHYKASYKRIK
jgi:hypothetical protein